MIPVAIPSFNPLTLCTPLPNKFPYGHESDNDKMKVYGKLLISPYISLSMTDVGVASEGYALTAASTAASGSTIYTGTITNGANNALAGQSFVVSGFTNAGNNGSFICTASTATSMTLTNSGGVAESASAWAYEQVVLTLTAAGTASAGVTAYTGTISGGGSNAYVGYTFLVAGFSTSANNGTFSCTASTTTTLTLANTAGAAETHAGTASLVTGGGNTVYVGTVTNGANNNLAGLYFTTASYSNSVNNGTFQCVASTKTTLTLANPSGVSETGATATAIAGQYLALGTYNPPGLPVKFSGVIPGVSGNVMMVKLFSARSGFSYFYDNYYNTVRIFGATNSTVGMGVEMAAGALPAGIVGSSLTLTAVAAANSSGNAVYTGTITNGGSNAFASKLVTITGFVNGVNNGVFYCVGSTTTTLTLANALTIAETHSGAAVLSDPVDFEATLTRV